MPETETEKGKPEDIEAWVMSELEKDTPPEIDLDPWVRERQARRPGEIRSWLKDWGVNLEGEPPVPPSQKPPRCHRTRR